MEGDRIFALVQRYTTKPRTEGRWEAHRRHIDLQLVVRGAERIGYVSIDDRRQVIPGVTYLDDDGKTIEFASTDVQATPEQIAKGEHRRM